MNSYVIANTEEDMYEEVDVEQVAYQSEQRAVRRNKIRKLLGKFCGWFIRLCCYILITCMTYLFIMATLMWGIDDPNNSEERVFCAVLLSCIFGCVGVLCCCKVGAMLAFD